MHKTQIFRAIALFTGIFAMSFVPIASADSLGGQPAKNCKGEGTVIGTNGIDIEYSFDKSEVYRMKNGDDTVTDFDLNGQNDIFRMDKGNDTVIATNGNDTLCLGKGNDFAATVDDYVDLIKCGPGNDTVHVDPYDIVKDDCENVTVIGQS